MTVRCESNVEEKYRQIERQTDRYTQISEIERDIDG